MIRVVKPAPGEALKAALAPGLALLSTAGLVTLCHALGTACRAHLGGSRQALDEMVAVLVAAEDERARRVAGESGAEVSRVVYSDPDAGNGEVVP